MSENEAQNWLSTHEPVIPALPYYHRQAVDKLDEGYSKASELAEVVILDPGMSLSFFHKVNAKRIISGRPFVESIQNAISFFSEQAIDELIRNHPVLESNETNPASVLAYQQIVARSLFQSMLLEDWADKQGIKSTSEMRSSGLLYNIGELCICLHDFEKYLAFIQHQPEQFKPGSEQDYFSFNFKQLGRLLVKKWALPERIDEALNPNSPGRKPRMNSLAAEVSFQTQYGWYHEQMSECLETASVFLDEPTDKLVSSVHQVAVKSAQKLPLTNIYHAANYLLHSPLEEASIKISFASAETDSVSIDPALLKPGSLNAASNSDPDLMDTIRDLARTTSSTQSQVLKTLINGLNEELNLSKTVLMMLSHDKSELSVRLSDGLENHPTFQSLSVKTQHAGLFKAFLKKTQALWVNTENYQKYNALIPGLFKATTLSNNFFIMSLFIGNKPIGIIYADRSGRSDATLDKPTFVKFKANIFLASKALNLIAERQQLRTS